MIIIVFNFVLNIVIQMSGLVGESVAMGTNLTLTGPSNLFGRRCNIFSRLSLFVRKRHSRANIHVGLGSLLGDPNQRRKKYEFQLL